MSSSRNVYQDHADKLTWVANTLGQYKVTVAEAIFNTSFIVNFIVGKLIHVFSQEEEIYNYYNNKGNIFNQLFVKKGWAWTTLVVVVFYGIHVQKSPANRGKVVSGAFLRWLAATAWWVLFTQWCFGLPLMDKVFLWTGGKCASIPSEKVAALRGAASGSLSRQFYLVGPNYESTAVSSYLCRRLKGSWEGGHDPSGHVFLLVHASLYLFHETKPFWPGWVDFVNSIRLFANDQTLTIAVRAKRLLTNVAHLPVLSLLSLWSFMLLVTNMYFHSLAEKLVGLIFGYLGVAAVYYAPRYIAKKDVPKKDV
ncbi:hypothetical protein JCM33374_g4062 [Metschnikowia sp. JCM 33374]|nr:hypothetical protein JCM33374_g4062 [Metschnikowia sp. JCM 33374]